MPVTHKFQPRSRYLPDERQQYFEFPGVRPDRGPCPCCKQPEGSYCSAGCSLIDPYAKDNAERLQRCSICAIASFKRPALHHVVILNKKRTVRHLVEAGWGSADDSLLRSVCHMVRQSRGGMIINGARWLL